MVHVPMLSESSCPSAPGTDLMLPVSSERCFDEVDFELPLLGLENVYDVVLAL